MNSPQDLLKQFETYRIENPFKYVPDELYEPIRYILNLGGKRIRPLLTLMGCDLFGGNIHQAFPAAYAVEMFHNFTLVHDDIMDNASLRRNMPTVHQNYGVARAILSGDVMMIYAYEFLVRLEADKFRKAIDLFNVTAIRVCEGQQYDLNFQGADVVTAEEYLRMIEYKTAALLACSLKLGAIAANAPDNDAEHLFHFGKNIGMCFQLLDDLLDAFGEEDKVGKKIGGDVAQNKKTFLFIKAMESADGVDRERLIYYIRNNVPMEEKVNHILEIYRKLGVEELARDEARRFHESAFASLDRVGMPDERKKVLRDFASMMLARQS